MNNHERAVALAARGYAEIAWLGKTTMDEDIYVAQTPELPGCTTHGDTMRDALANLKDARTEYIEMLLDDDVAVPEPMRLVSGDVLTVEII